jgi:hypothetical protein
MKKELYDYSAEEATEYMNYEGIRELDYVEADGYKLFSDNVSNPVKLRAYEDRTFKLEVLVPDEVQCVPCELKYKTANLDSCPCCGTSTRDVMLRNKVQDEPFRRFEGEYTNLLNAALKVAQPVMAYTADNFTKEQAYELYDVARKEFDNVVASLKPFGFIFAEGILDRIVDMKDKDINVKVMKELMGDDTNDQSILDFSK